MRNIINETPFDEQYGSGKFAIEYIDKNDITNMQILDIGCGFGWFEYNMLRFSPCKIVGIDISEDNVLNAQSVVSINPDKVNVMIGSAVSLPFENESFDCVVSWDVIEHIPKNTELQMLSEVRRVLKKGGKYYLSTPFDNIFNNIFDPAWWLVGHRHYSKKRISKFIEEADLKIDEIFVKGGKWMILSVINMYISKWVFRRPPVLKNFFNNKVNDEFKNKSGVHTLFIKGTK